MVKTPQKRSISLRASPTVGEKDGAPELRQRRLKSPRRLGNVETPSYNVQKGPAVDVAVVWSRSPYQVFQRSPDVTPPRQLAGEEGWDSSGESLTTLVQSKSELSPEESSK